MLADAECLKHSNAENGFKFLGLATLIAVVAICHVAKRDHRSDKAVPEFRTRVLELYNALPLSHELPVLLQ